MSTHSARCEQSQITETSVQSNKEDSKKLIEKDGEIGYIKNKVFWPMTNFTVRCKGYVVDNTTNYGVNGFLFTVIPKDHFQMDIEGSASEDGYVLLT